MTRNMLLVLPAAALLAVLMLMSRGSVSGQIAGIPPQAVQGTNVRNFGCVGNGTTDDTTCWTNAIADAHAKNGYVWCPSGNYKISALTIPSSTYITGPARIDAGSGFAGICRLTSSGTSNMLTLSGSNFVTIENVYLDGAATATAGIFSNGSVSAQVLKCYFSRFANGNAAIRTGGSLYFDIRDNVFDGTNNGYAVDAQNMYSSVPGTTYYGINVGTISGNRVYSHGGMRLSGILTVADNDFELTLDSPALAALYLCESGFMNTFFRVTGNYFEDHKGTATVLTQISACDQAQVEMQSNRIYGDNSANCIAVDFASHGAPYGLQASHNQVVNCSKGFDYSPIAGGINAAGTSQYYGNLFIGVTTPYVIADVAPTSMTTAASATQYSAVANRGFIFSGSAIVGTVRTGSNLTTIDLSQGNQWTLSGTAAHTLGAFTNAVPGQFFTLFFNSAFTTVTNSVFHLCGAADKTYTTGSTAMFIVNSASAVYQVCNQ